MLEIVTELALEDGELRRKISHQLIWWLTANSLILDFRMDSRINLAPNCA
jgi:hypothetical protein